MKLIILDTNVVSGVMAPRPNPNVARWLAEQIETDLYITAITKAELRYGAELLPEGRRRSDLEIRIDRILSECFGSRILPFEATQHAFMRRLGRVDRSQDARWALKTP